MGRVFKHTLAKAEADAAMYRRPKIGIHAFQLNTISFLLELGKFLSTERTAEGDAAFAEEYREYEQAARQFLSPVGGRR